MEQLTFWSVGLLAKASPSPGKEADFPTSAADWPCTLYGLWQRLSLSGSCGKTSPELFPLRLDGTSGHSSGRWMVSGIISHGECLTLNSSECPSAAVESSLSDILETGDIQQRFYLSPAACAGILRRAEKRGRTLPSPYRMPWSRWRGRQSGTGRILRPRDSKPGNELQMGKRNKRSGRE